MNVLKIAAAATALALTTQASAQVVVDFTGSAEPNNFFAAFTPENATPSDAGIVINVPSGGDTFGGVGFAGIETTTSLTPGGTGFVTALLGAGNENDLIVAFVEGNGEVFSFSVPASSFNETTFTTVEFSLDSFFFNDQDGVIDGGGIIESTVQSPFGAGGASSFTVANVGVVDTAVPEPASLALLGLGGIALIGRRRRSA